jgi:hypothetical protein
LKLLAGACLSLLLSSAAHAGEVDLSFAHCARLDVAEVRRIVDVESRLRPEPLRASVDCEGSRVVIEREGGRRELELGTVLPSKRPRLLALAIMELEGATAPPTVVETPPPPAPASTVADSPPVAPPPAPPEPEKTQTPAAPPAHTAATKPKEAAPPARAERTKPKEAAPPFRRFRLLAFGAGTDFFSGTGLLGGGGIRVGGDHRYHLSWWADLSEAHGSVGTSLGSVSVDVINASLLAGAHKTWSKVAIRGGIGVGGGAVRFGGHAASTSTLGQSFWGGWFGPHLGGGLSVTPVSRLVLEASMDLGYVAVPVGALVDGRSEVAIDKLWLGFQLGVGFFF